VADYEEIVFCGFGEPTERIDTVLEIAEYVKAKWKKTSGSIRTGSAT
jgi:MoaA/NifB/PqqE/SkfB family radical SAM enzyme